MRECVTFILDKVLGIVSVHMCMCCVLECLHVREREGSKERGKGRERPRESTSGDRTQKNTLYKKEHIGGPSGHSGVKMEPDRVVP